MRHRTPCLLPVFGFFCVACASLPARGGSGDCSPVVLEYANEAAQPVRLRAMLRVDGYFPGPWVDVLPGDELAPRETVRVEGKACVPVGSVLTHSAEVVGVREAWNPSTLRATGQRGGPRLACRVTVYGGGASFSVRHVCAVE
jgi:hypothetical protein